MLVVVNFSVFLLPSIHHGGTPKLLNASFEHFCWQIVDSNLYKNNTGEVIQSMENVTNFLEGVREAGVPTDYIFDVSDLEDTSGPGERPRVVACLLCLKRMSEGRLLTGDYSTPARSPFGAVPSGRMRSQYHYSNLRHGVPSQAGRDLSPDVDQDAAPLKLAAGKGVAAAVGVTRLMQQCTSMLRERMWADAPQGQTRNVQTPTPPRGLSAGTPEGALEAMGPVLESVLGSLTQEYEKRLLAKASSGDDCLGCQHFWAMLWYSQ